MKLLIFQVYLAEELFEIDVKQLKAAFMLFMKPNTYVIGTGDNQYIYYESEKKDKIFGIFVKMRKRYVFYHWMRVIFICILRKTMI